MHSRCHVTVTTIRLQNVHPTFWCHHEVEKFFPKADPSLISHGLDGAASPAGPPWTRLPPNPGGRTLELLMEPASDADTPGGRSRLSWAPGRGSQVDTGRPALLPMRSWLLFAGAEATSCEASSPSGADHPPWGNGAAWVWFHLFPKGTEDSNLQGFKDTIRWLSVNSSLQACRPWRVEGGFN